MENREYLCTLFDIYGGLLTNIEQDTFINYYKEDLSLSEIAENRGISKSSVGKTLKGAEDKLNNYEKVLKSATIYKEIKEILSEEQNIDSIKTRLTTIIEK